jgi:uncharacterized protein
MENFTPVSGLIGGILIGLAAVMLLLLNGRIAGISGIAGGIIGSSGGNLYWRLAFVAGLVLGPLIVTWIKGAAPEVSIQATWPSLILAGLLVGFGTRLGSGCTSGHGVCGIARGSMRSIMATATFFAVAVATVFIVRHVMGN